MLLGELIRLRRVCKFLVTLLAKACMLLINKNFDSKNLASSFLTVSRAVSSDSRISLVFLVILSVFKRFFALASCPSFVR